MAIDDQFVSWLRLYHPHYLPSHLSANENVSDNQQSNPMPIVPTSNESASPATPVSKTLASARKVLSDVSEFLIYPPTSSKKKSKPPGSARVLTSQESLIFLKQKEQKKRDDEATKEQRKIDREVKRMQREAEQKKKAEQRELKAAEKKRKAAELAVEKKRKAEERERKAEERRKKALEMEESASKGKKVQQKDSLLEAKLDTLPSTGKVVLTSAHFALETTMTIYPLKAPQQKNGSSAPVKNAANGCTRNVQLGMKTAT